ncbi:MAG: hypothetical protein V4582_15450 [Pseudomonadota bacterium]
MLAFFKWLGQAGSAAEGAALGVAAVACRVDARCTVPPACIGVLADAGGRTRRVAAGARMEASADELAFCFHPGPYVIDVQPYALAPELGLRLHVAVDAPDPRVPQQRFDLFLCSEGGASLSHERLRGLAEEALRGELEQGNLELPPCTTLAEWHAFRARLNQLLYTRFGLSVDDCVPTDLGAQVDYADLLRSRAHGAVLAPPKPQAPAVPSQEELAATDADALRRLFLELPRITHGLRQASMAGDAAQFRHHQSLLQRLDRLGLEAGTMPSLAWATPDRALEPAQQWRRARHSKRAARALDEAWALLARLNLADGAARPTLLDDADRIVANLEHDVVARRAVRAGEVSS